MDRANGAHTRRPNSLDLADAYAELTDYCSCVGQHGTHERGLVQLTGVAACLRDPPRPRQVRGVGRAQHSRWTRLIGRPTCQERPNTGSRGSRLGNRLLITARAQRAIRRLCADAGRQHLVLTWPGGANYLSATMHHAGPYDVVVGHVARCPIYADLRQLELFRTRYMLIDVNDYSHAPRRPLLNTTHHPRAHNQAETPANLSQAPAALRAVADVGGGAGTRSR